jgi:hypothetical protein
VVLDANDTHAVVEVDMADTKLKEKAAIKQRATKAHNVLDRMLDPKRREEVIQNYMSDFNLSREEAIRQLEEAGF